MADNEDESLPASVRDLKEETEELIRIFDEEFLRTCGILWEKDVSEEPPAHPWPLLSQFRRAKRRNH